MAKQQLVALKSMGRLRPGDQFDAPARHARVLIAIGKARPDYDAAVKEELVAPPEPAATDDDAEEDLSTLRAKAQAAGVRVDLRWGPRRLQKEIDRVAATAAAAKAEHEAEPAAEEPAPAAAAEEPVPEAPAEETPQDPPPAPEPAPANPVPAQTTFNTGLLAPPRRW